jgi:hypothetical protein
VCDDISFSQKHKNVGEEMTRITVGAARALIAQMNDPGYADHAVGVLRTWLTEEKNRTLSFNDDARLLLQPHIDALPHD